jgi:hypothetical protein
VYELHRVTEFSGRELEIPERVHEILQLLRKPAINTHPLRALDKKNTASAASRTHLVHGLLRLLQLLQGQLIKIDCHDVDR